MTAYSLNEIFGSVARLGVILSLGSMLVTGFLHGDLMAFAGAGLQYWVMQPVFWNILQVGWAAAGLRHCCRAVQPTWKPDAPGSSRRSRRHGHKGGAWLRLRAVL